MNNQSKEGCLNCGGEITQKKGKRKRLYCSDLCRATYHQKKKVPVIEGLTIQLPKDYINTEKIMVLKEDGTLTDIEDFPKNENFDLWMQAFGALQQVVDDEGKQVFFQYNPNDIDLVTPISSAAAGKTVTVTLQAGVHYPHNNESLIAQYEQELTTLPEKGQFATQRRKWLKNKIYELKQQTPTQ